MLTATISTCNPCRQFAKLQHSIANLFSSISPQKAFIILIIFMVSMIPSSNGYKILPKKVSFTDAQTYCERTGSTLASIHSYDDLVKVQALCNSVESNEICWIGGTHDGINGVNNCTYSWIDGSEWNYNPPRYPGEQCQFNQTYSCITTPQDTRYEANTLHDCESNLLRPICNDG